MPDLIQSSGNGMLLAIGIAVALVTRQTYLWIKFEKIKFLYISAYDKLAFAACAFLSLFMSILLFTIKENINYFFIISIYYCWMSNKSAGY